MGQKVSPIGLRIGINRDWQSRWYAEKDYADLLLEDIKIREYLKDYYKKASISLIEIERSKNRIKITIETSKPGMVIGREGSVKDAAVKVIEKMTGKTTYISIVEIRRPELDAQLVAQSIAEQLENRASFRRAQKMAIQRVLRAGAKGVKTMVSGRLGGAEMARSEGYSEGNVPLHTLRADIDYAWAEALTTYGKLGVKVWIYKGEILPDKKGEAISRFDANQNRGRNDRKDRPNNNRGRNDRNDRNNNNNNRGRNDRSNDRNNSGRGGRQSNFKKEGK